MKIQIICERCNAIAELKSNQNGNQVQLWRLKDQGFRADSPLIELDGDLRNIEDIDEISAEFKEIRINCLECGDYIVLEP